MLPWILCVLLLAAVTVLLVKYFRLRQGVDDIAAQFGRLLREDTNHVIFVTHGNGHAKRLAAVLNRHLTGLRRQRLQYLSGDRELKDAVTSISHDLRTPLTAIAGYLELLEEENMSEAVREYLTRIEGRVEAMKSLTEELFRYSVLVASEETRPQETLVNKVLEESLLGCMGAFSVKGITPEVHLPDVPVRRLLDPNLLARVFGNILSNALKYSDGDLTVEMSKEGVIRFTNTAKALTPVMAERLFDRFYTVESARNSTGLGLCIARLLTERMGGAIGARFADGRLTVEVSFNAEFGMRNAEFKSK